MVGITFESSNRDLNKRMLENARLFAEDFKVDMFGRLINLEMIANAWDVDDCKTIVDDRGRLSVIESDDVDIENFKRLYCIVFAKKGITRGHHAQSTTASFSCA